MTGQELREAMEGRGLTATDLGQLLGIHAVSVRRWTSGAYPVPRYVEYIIELWEKADGSYQRGIEIGAQSTRAIVKRAVVACPSLDENGYICEKAAMLRAIAAAFDAGSSAS